MFGRRALFLIFFLRSFLLFRFLLRREITKLGFHQFHGPKKTNGQNSQVNFFFFRSGVLRGKLPQSTRSWNRITNVELVILLEAVRKSWLGPFQVPMNKPLVWFSFLHAEDDESDGEEEVPHEEETLRIWGKYKIYIKLRKSIHTFWAKPLISASSILSQSIGVHF